MPRVLFIELGLIRSNILSAKTPFTCLNCCDRQIKYALSDGSIGFTASYHIQKRGVLEAKRLALNPEIKIKSIAFQLGYVDVAHFIKFFKSCNRISFTDFRKINLMQN
ncbi:helix-turn-helix domain-containing protein [Dyadobacter subterraneus]|uniref:AraC family transcriptional regulator n=1 Tax=Dyadobacter subterraneus TaxID=2773304 RepID=A0ABR9W835_9BACT|nr:AraC family transcriptional regulator [Dyadobacter subterraneus]